MARQLHTTMPSAPEGQREEGEQRHGKENLEEVEEVGIHQAAHEEPLRGELEEIARPGNRAASKVRGGPFSLGRLR